MYLLLAFVSASFLTRGFVILVVVVVVVLIVMFFGVGMVVKLSAGCDGEKKEAEQKMLRERKFKELSSATLCIELILG